MLVTSRAYGRSEVAVPVEVDVLARAESVAILVNRVPGLSATEAGRMAQALGDLPLALAQAAAYMEETGTLAGEYLDLLAARAAQVLDQGQPPLHRQSLTAVTQLAFDRLRHDDPAAAQVVAICSFLDPEPIPAEWFPRAAAWLPAELADKAADPVAWRQVLGQVKRHALARLDQQGLQMHRLTQAIVRAYLPPDQVAATQALAAALLTVNHSDDEELPAAFDESNYLSEAEYDKDVDKPGITWPSQQPSGRQTPGSGFAVPVSQMTITMLGVNGSGKSTYILGMYAQLVHGVHGCLLHMSDPDSAADIIRELYALRSGAAPAPTADRPTPHEFILTRRGSAEQTVIDLADFRGGAVFDVTHRSESDTAQLQRRLLNSDSIFVVLDSKHFREPVTPSRLQAVREATGADRFADLITRVLADRKRAGRPAPSIAILLTKADLIDGRPGSVERGWNELAGEIRQLLGAAFQPQLAVGIFPVSVGGFGALPDGQLLPGAVDSRGAADPVIFAVGWFLKACQFEVDRQREQTLAARQDAAHRLNELVSKTHIIRWFTRSRIIAAQAEINEANAQIAALDARWDDLGRHSQALLSRTGTGTNHTMGTGHLWPHR